MPTGNIWRKNMNSLNNSTTCSPGFALTELIVVIAIIAILLGIAVPNYSQWQRKHYVESQVKEMTSDFSELRLRAMTRKQRHSITVNQSNYTFKSYSSDDELLAAGTPVPPATAVIPTRTVKKQLKSNSTTYYSGETFEIDPRGLLVGISGTIYLDDSNSGAYIDCLTLHTVRINPGKKNSGWSRSKDHRTRRQIAMFKIGWLAKRLRITKYILLILFYNYLKYFFKM